MAAVRQEEEEHPLEWRTRAPNEHPLAQVCDVAMETVAQLVAMVTAHDLGYH